MINTTPFKQTFYSKNRVQNLRRVGIRSISDYSPFGVQLSGRTMGAENYRFGFQGQEHDDEIKGEGNSVNYTYRMHDPRLGRFFAIDPLTRKYPWYSSYQFSGNKLIHCIELEGLEENEVHNKLDKNGKVVSSEFRYNTGAEKLKNDLDVYVITTDHNGNVTSAISNVKDVTWVGGKINPTKAPEHIFGTKHYYYWRNLDFRIRHTLMGDYGKKKAPRYYMGYGDKYAKRFKEITRPKLSNAGQKWLDKTLINLQEAIEDKLAKSPDIELDDQKFHNFAFDSHPDAYEDAGLLELGGADLLRILFTPDIKDTFFTSEGWRQLYEIGKDYYHEVANEGEGFAYTTF